jgi:hypothetical protein
MRLWVLPILAVMLLGISGLVAVWWLYEAPRRLVVGYCRRPREV